jgi:hypothetical protein
VRVLGRKPGTSFFRPRSREHPDDEVFAAEMRPRVVVLDLSGVFGLEYSALKMLMEAERRQREVGLHLWLVGLSPEVLAATSDDRCEPSVRTGRR